MKIEYNTVLKITIGILLVLVIILTIYSPNTEKLPDNNSSNIKNDTAKYEEQEFTIVYEESRNNIRRYTFDGSYNFTDFDSSSIDINDKISPDTNDNENKIHTSNRHGNMKNYESEDFEESTATNHFFLPSHDEDIINLSDKIDNLRRELNTSYLLNHKCEIEINRNFLLADSKKKILCIPERFLKVNLQIRFKEELGIDIGGLKKEWFNLIFKEALNLNLGYFCSSSDDANTLRPSVYAKKKFNYKYFYRFVGRIIGMAILQDCQVTTNFDTIVYKYLLNKKFKFSDLQLFDSTLFGGFNFYLENDIDYDEFSFVHSYKKNGKDEQKELILNGSNISVTNKNKKSYLKLKTEMILYRLIQDQLNAMKKGLYDIIEPNLISNFTENEFELLLCGISDIDVTDWKNNTYYINYNEDCEIIQWFWMVVSEFSLEEKRKLLQFATGSDRVPFGGFSNLKAGGSNYRFNIETSFSDDTHLPIAHTCFNRIDLPRYTSKDNLKEKLYQAITEGNEGFGDY